MHEKSIRCFLSAALLFLVFILFTLSLYFIDVKPVGPEGSAVGLSSLNLFVFEQIGVHPFFYSFSTYLCLIPIGFVCGFAAAGFLQLIKRKNIWKVDKSLLLLGAFYILLLSFYLFFELLIINCRPVILNGIPEASYPSSHTMFAVCVLGTAVIQLRNFFPKKKRLLRGTQITISLLGAVIVITRFLSGVHWFSDILGSLLLSASLLSFYRAVNTYFDESKEK